MKRLFLLFAPFVLSCGAETAAETRPRIGSITHQDHATMHASVLAHRKTAARIIEAAMADEEGWDQLAHLTDRIGARLSGSRALAKAVSWTQTVLREAGLSNVHGEEVMVPNWERGKESGAILAPIKKPLTMLGLGNSVGTSRTRGAVVVVKNFEELAARGAEVRGKIVLYNAAMPPYTEHKGSGYGLVAQYRTHGAIKAAEMGAKAVLVRSITAHSLDTPHTGVTLYKDGVKKIPAAAITVEDSELIHRLSRAGIPVEVELRMGAKMRRDAKSANVLAELPGREKPEEIVLLGAHLDSWDVGQGAHDDGAGCLIMMRAVILLKRLGLQPRRTIRVVLFTNEENGLRGSKNYAERHATEVKNHVMAIESDSGAFAPRGFTVQGDAHAVADAKAVTSLLGRIRPMTARAGFSGSNIMMLGKAGVPSLGLWVEGDKYFDYHHTHADTLDKVDPTAFRQNVAAVAVLAYIAAEWPHRFGAPREKTPPKNKSRR